MLTDCNGRCALSTAGLRHATNPLLAIPARARVIRRTDRRTPTCRPRHAAHLIGLAHRLRISPPAPDPVDLLGLVTLVDPAANGILGGAWPQPPEVICVLEPAVGGAVIRGSGCRFRDATSPMWRGLVTRVWADGVRGSSSPVRAGAVR